MQSNLPEKLNIARTLCANYHMSMKKHELNLKSQLCHRLYIASNAMTRSYKPLLDEIGLSYPQYLVMMALWEEDKISMSELATVTYIDTGSLTLVVKKMADKGLLKIVNGEEDKRKKFIHLTSQGANLQKRAIDIPEKMKCKLVSLDSAEIEGAFSLLDKLNHDLTNS
ncbi:MarR family winged helix-turn-helix transcriptional regulator [Agarilytica rhodophyticola]|uniref:MarR family winged helix-turn-helix transcriptional regulator n=1 Tax=Agarilytica rhodophyticola TaxID=1737490 RepID=UPI001C1F4867|nr:MarR family transcriptional regulator [Agarilytica rhodophyticola]